MSRSQLILGQGRGIDWAAAQERNQIGLGFDFGS